MVGFDQWRKSSKAATFYRVIPGYWTNFAKLNWRQEGEKTDAICVYVITA